MGNLYSEENGTNNLDKILSKILLRFCCWEVATPPNNHHIIAEITKKALHQQSNISPLSSNITLVSQGGARDQN